MQPLGLVAVHHHALPAQQNMQTAITERAPLVGQIAQLLAQGIIAAPDGTGAHALSIGVDNTARPPRVHPTACQEINARRASPLFWKKIVDHAALGSKLRRLASCRSAAA